MDKIHDELGSIERTLRKMRAIAGEKWSEDSEDFYNARELAFIFNQLRKAALIMQTPQFKQKGLERLEQLLTSYVWEESQPSEAHACEERQSSGVHVREYDPDNYHAI